MTIYMRQQMNCECQRLIRKVLERKRKSPKDPFYFWSYGKEKIKREKREEHLIWKKHVDRIPSEEKVNQL